MLALSSDRDALLLVSSILGRYSEVRCPNCGRRVRLSTRTEKRSTARTVDERVESGTQTSVRTKGSAMKMISKPNPSHQYILIVSSGGKKTLGIT